MSASDYNKGFGGRSAPSAARHATPARQATAHGGAPAMTRHGIADSRPPVGERGRNVLHARRADPTKLPWSRHTGRVGWWCVGAGFMLGLPFLVTTGNWAAPLILPILTGMIGSIIYWLFARVLDTFRGL